MSSHVYDMADLFGGLVEITDFYAELPAFSGVPDGCLDPGSPENPVRFVDFVNGGVDVLCHDDMMRTGDINLNDNICEIGDAILFANYFHFGLSVFTINPAGQIMQTEVNGDGETLTVRDYFFLLRIIIGGGLPVR